MMLQAGPNVITLEWRSVLLNRYEHAIATVYTAPKGPNCNRQIEIGLYTRVVRVAPLILLSLPGEIHRSRAFLLADPYDVQIITCRSGHKHKNRFIYIYIPECSFLEQSTLIYRISTWISGR